MSVINQMLKDLDQRQSEQKGMANAVLPATKKTSMSRVVLIIIAIILLNVLGVFSWQLYSENQQLKDQVQANALAISSNSAANTKVMTYSNEKIDDKPSTHQTYIADTEPVAEKASMTASLGKEESSEKPAVPSKQPLLSTENAVIANNDSTKVTALTTSLQNNTARARALDTAKVENTGAMTKIKQLETITKVKPSLTISRTQLTPQALAANKITEAEQAIERNDIIKAEALFEEVLLIMPEHETARKQLAALWYGKKSYQDAVNLLSQGIALAPQSEEMRIMTARIYYEQGQALAAYDILSPLKHSTSTELQALLANTAADLNEYDNAISAYQKLIVIEPHLGRWKLGLAVSLDSLGKFVQARDAYKQAISRNNLSNSAMQFARQRLIELGE